MSLFNLKALAGRSTALVTAWHVYDNYKTKRMGRRGTVETPSGSTHLHFNLEESLRYIRSVYEDYCTYGQMNASAFSEKRILEIGPGDNFGVALQFLVEGARQVVCLDRFYSERDVEQQMRIYRGMRETLVEDRKARFDRAIRIDRDIQLREETLSYIHGKGIEDVEDSFAPGTFDFIISRAVMEHVYDCDASFRVMDRLLAPGGWMMHKVDFRDHDMYSRFGFHPLTFLTIGEGVYRRMSLDCGKPNRRLVDYYREKMKALGYEARLYATHLVGQEQEVVPHLDLTENGFKVPPTTQKLLGEIRPRLVSQYRQLPDEDLMVAGTFLVARKPV